MKPTFSIHFSSERPTRPGHWLTRRNNYITVLDIKADDLERDKRQPDWLEGEWGARLELVERDLVPMDKRKFQEYLDAKILANHESNRPERVQILQEVRQATLGSLLDLPENSVQTDPPEQPMKDRQEAG